MKMNLAQMQVIQRTLKLFSSADINEYSPVVEYNGRVLTADFYNEEFVDLNNKFYDFISPDILSNSTVENPIDARRLDPDSAVFKVGQFILSKKYPDVVKYKTFYFLFLEKVACMFDNEPIPSKFLTNVQYLDQSISPKVDFLRLDDNPEFEFISLISKN